MSARSETRLWIAQRATAALLALCVLVHLITMTVAAQGGLTATIIVARCTTTHSASNAAVARCAIHNLVSVRTLTGLP